MSEQKETPAELGEIISTASFYLGLSSGLGDAAKLLREWAGVKFSLGNDELAYIYRDLAKDIERQARIERDKYDTERRPLKDRAFAELEKLS